MAELQKIFLNFIYLILGFGKFEIEMVAPNDTKKIFIYPYK